MGHFYHQKKEKKRKFSFLKMKYQGPELDLAPTFIFLKKEKETSSFFLQSDSYLVFLNT